jgi:membrane fusion protein (multidrug efflux system)
MLVSIIICQKNYMRRSLYQLALFFVPLFVFTFCHSKKQAETKGRGPGGPVNADVFVVNTHTVSDDIEVPGALLPFEETQIRCEVSGRIVQLNIHEGTRVTKGALLVKLFDKDLQAQLNKLKVQLQIKEKTADRNKELLSINGISQQDYDLSTLDVENLKADIQSLEISISKTEIRAPYNGKIGLRNVSLGSYLTPTDIVATIREVDQLKLEFSIPEKYVKDIQKGYNVSFKIDGGEKMHKASVLATENSVDQNTRTLKVKALVNEHHPELVPGIFAKVNLQLGKDNDALMIPSQAIIPQARDKQVIVLHKDSVQFVVVETGIRDSAYVQILSGLKKGDTIVTSGLMSIRPNSKVKIAKVHRLQ